MRILVTTTPGLGHNLPVLPLALALRDAGHELHWIVGQGSADTITEHGIEVTVAGIPVAERRAELNRRYPDLFTTRPDAEARAVAFTTHFAELAAPRVLEMLEPFVADWRPDLLLHDAAELAGPLVAAARDIPSVCHGFGQVVLEESMRRAGAVMAAHWTAAGLAPDPHAGSYRGLYIDIYPPSLCDVDMAHVPRVQLRRPADGRPASGSLVYVTFGTVFNEVDDGFRTAIRGAAASAEEVLVTVGPDGDPAAVGEVPDNVQVERFVPQSEVLPRCSAVVCHGGSGTVLASLAHGVPLVCLPRGADQFSNGVNVARSGAGVVLRPPEVSEVSVTTAMAQVLGPDAHRAAGALAEEIAAMPSDAEVVAVIEAFAGS